MTQMKSFAELKRFFAEPGATIVQTRHNLSSPDRPSRIIGVERRVIKVQSNAVQFEGGSWFYSPNAVKRSDFRSVLKRVSAIAELAMPRCNHIATSHG